MPSATTQAAGAPAEGVRPSEAGATATSAPPTSAKGGEAPAPTSATAASPTTDSGAFTVKLKTDDQCWMQITTDGKSEEITMPANSEKVITAKDKLVIRAGNVGALNILFNGRALASQGEYGEVRTLTFGPQGLEAPPATP